MKKNFTFLGIVAFLVLLVYAGDKNSEIYISWRSFNSHISLSLFIILLAIISAFITLLNHLVHIYFKKQADEVLKIMQKTTSDYEEENIVLNRKEINSAMMLLVETMTAITEGDMIKAKTSLADLKQIIGNDAIIDILLLKIYKGEKNFDKMEELSEKILSNPNLQLIGFKAAIEAQMQKKEFEQALKNANKAFEIRQDLYWVIESAFSLRVKSKDWEGALQVLDSGYQKKLINQEKYTSLKAVVLYELAKKSKKDGDSINFFKFCSQSFELEPKLVPVALALAEYYMENDRQVRKAAKILSKIWKINPTTEIAEAYLNLWPEDTDLERVHRMETLALTNGKNPSVNNIMLSELYCKANLWAKAKSEFEIFLINNPATKKLAKTIAYYEKKANNNEQAATNWKKKSLNCVDDNMWVCSVCGKVSSKWHSYCKKCGETGSFEWHLFAIKEKEKQKEEK